MLNSLIDKNWEIDTLVLLQTLQAEVVWKSLKFLTVSLHAWISVLLCFYLGQQISYDVYIFTSFRIKLARCEFKKVAMSLKEY